MIARSPKTFSENRGIGLFRRWFKRLLSFYKLEQILEIKEEKVHIPLFCAPYFRGKKCV